MNEDGQKKKGGALSFLFVTSVPAGIRLFTVINALLGIYFLATFLPLAVFVSVESEEVTTVLLITTAYHLVVGAVLILSLLPLWYGRALGRALALISGALLVAYSFLWALLGMFFIGGFFLLIGALELLYIGTSKSARRYSGKEDGKILTD